MITASRAGGDPTVPEAFPSAAVHGGVWGPAEADARGAGAPDPHGAAQSAGAPGRLRRLRGAHLQGLRRYGHTMTGVTLKVIVSYKIMIQYDIQFIYFFISKFGK